MKTEKETTLKVVICECCGHKSQEHRHRLSKGLINSLVKMKDFIMEQGANRVHPINDLQLSNFEYNNFQKLRYFGLVARYKSPETKRKVKGIWLLTKNGNNFLKGNLEISLHIKTMNNKISGRSIKKTNIGDFYANDNKPYWDTYSSDDSSDITIKSYVVVYPCIYEMDEVEYTVDKNGQTKFFF